MLFVAQISINKDMTLNKVAVLSMFDSKVIMHVGLPHCKLRLQAFSASLQHAQPNKGIHTCSTLPVHTAAPHLYTVTHFSLRHCNLYILQDAGY